MPNAREVLALSPLKRRLLTELVRDTPSKMIAQQFAISEASLCQHVRSLYRKLGLTGRTEVGKKDWPIGSGEFT